MLTNCKNCGAPLRAMDCAYCGTRYLPPMMVMTPEPLFEGGSQHHELFAASMERQKQLIRFAEAAKGEQDKEFQASMKMAEMTEADKQRAHEMELAQMQQKATKAA